jgi:hypothetical protein
VLPAPVAVPAAFWPLAHEWYRRGYLVLGEEPR